MISVWRRQAGFGAAIGAVIGVSIVTAIGASLATATADPAAAPAIRLSRTNHVPACVTPARLTRFLKARNTALLPKFGKIAGWYKYHGEAWRVRWDYAFFQMLLETNYLSFRAPNGRKGDVDPRQNNFAGIGATGGGVPGNRFADVGTGVLAQIQHLVVYSGQRLARPVAPRTRLKQDAILKASQRVLRSRPVTYQDLSGRWAVDRRYGRSIEAIAGRFRARFCRNVRTRPMIARRRARVAPRRGVRSQPSPAPTRACRVQVASFGGSKTLLIRSVDHDTVQLTALDVAPGFEAEMARDFANAHAPGAVTIARFGNRRAALRQAHAMCRKLTRRR